MKITGSQRRVGDDLAHKAARPRPKAKISSKKASSGRSLSYRRKEASDSVFDEASPNPMLPAREISCFSGHSHLSPPRGRINILCHARHTKAGRQGCAQLPYTHTLSGKQPQAQSHRQTHAGTHTHMHTNTRTPTPTHTNTHQHVPTHTNTHHTHQHTRRAVGLR